MSGRRPLFSVVQVQGKVGSLPPFLLGYNDHQVGSVIRQAGNKACSRLALAIPLLLSSLGAKGGVGPQKKA